ncbi:amidase [Sphingomonas sp. AOB5]|uniref:amidase n=1 Tax=Sphingomonas sp. AOB5 TaxID=3034017 RepID=UPI0023F7A68C|nr:amidase [Sphingomonas sp. AOB5]MDF7777429.1 amidase [Sphingomonas sp. AOB5]
MRNFMALALAIGAAVPAMAQTAPVGPVVRITPSVEEASIAQMRRWLADGDITSEMLVRAYLARIEAMDRRGPTLRSIIAIAPDAIEQARASDRRRIAGKLLGPLDGIPILIKDNIETREMPTTAGSLALKDNATKRDAPVVALLRGQGAVILGKTNMSEWANMRSTDSMSGWSAIGGLVRNPYALDRTACGSSSGSGAAVAASLAAAALGTETDGSVVCPSSMNGLVGLKPTVGLVSRTHVVPISHSQDTPGPMGRSVTDVALLFSAMIGSDSRDAATKDANRYRRDYAAGLSLDALRGVRVGYIRPAGLSAAVSARFDKALKDLEAAGAVLVDVKQPGLPGLGDAEFLVLQVEFRVDLDAYLGTTPPAVTVRTLDQLIAFNIAHRDREMPFFTQDIFGMAAKTKGLDDPAYREARAKSLKLAGEDGIAAMLKSADVQMLVMPSYGPAWLSDPVHGDGSSGPSASRLPAVSGYPHLTVPMGLAGGLPVGLSFIGAPYSDGLLLRAGYAYEQQSKARVAPRYLPSVEADLGVR